MKITAKLRKAILAEVQLGSYDVIDELIPETRKSPPEMWDRSIKDQWDLITEVEHRIGERLKTLLKSS